MELQTVKYKLVKRGTGWGTPDGIIEGGHIYKWSKNIQEMVFTGKCDITKGFPDGVLEIIDEKSKKLNDTSLEESALDDLKKQRYSKEADPLFIEAVRKKLLGDDTKWNEYVSKCDEIRNLGKPSEPVEKKSSRRKK